MTESSGSLWIDRPDALEIAEREPDPWLRASLTQFVQQGFLIIPDAVPHAAIDHYRNEVASLKGARTGLVLGHFEGDVAIEDGDLLRPLSRILDPYVYAPAALDIIFAPKVDAFLGRVFDDGVLAFQGLHFEVGSTQAIHQDTAYIATQEPSRFAAAWVAMEDIDAGSGELIYYPGSHRWRGPWEEAERGWHEAHHHYLAWLANEGAIRGVKAEAFRPGKGDALIWHADLAHGGGPITKPGATRSSFVTHYCALADAPRYFRRPDRAVKHLIRAGQAVASRHYELPGRLPT